MNAESYSFLQVEADEEPMLFASIFSPAEHEQACIGHLRGDFGRGTEFWTRCSVNANLKMSIFAGMKCYFSPVSMKRLCSLDYPLLAGLKPVKS